MPRPLESIEMIRRLVAMDTTSRNSNLEIIDFIADHLAGFGIEGRLVHDESGRKANLYATLGPTDKPGIALSGHTDVVPIDGQTWNSDPWLLSERDGRLFGRGAADMKAFLGILLVKAPEMLRREPTTPIHLVFTYDEEVGCLGVRRLLTVLPGSAGAALCLHHRRADGYEGHGRAQGQDEPALPCARARMPFLFGARGCQCRGIRRRGHRPAARHGPARSPVKVLSMPISTWPIRRFIRGSCAAARRSTSCPSIAPSISSSAIVPGVDPQALLAEVKGFAENELAPQMKAVAPEAGFTWEQISAFPGLDMPVDSEIVAFVKSLTGGNSVGKVAFGTEGGLYQEAGIPTVICGPGSITQAHKPDEFIEIDQIAQCEAFMDRLMDRVCRLPAQA